MLMRHYLDANKSEKMLSTGKKLLAKFPGNAPTLEVMGDLCMHKAKFTEAIMHLSAALKINPLDARLGSSSAMHTKVIRKFAARSPSGLTRPARL